LQQRCCISHFLFWCTQMMVCCFCLLCVISLGSGGWLIYADGLGVRSGFLLVLFMPLRGLFGTWMNEYI
jgi:hypothetical protein